MRRSTARDRSQTDYAPIDIFNPLDGSKFTVYNLAPAKLGLVDRVDVTATDSDLRRRSISGLEFGFNARIKNATAFGAYSVGRELNTYCDGSNAGDTLATTVASDPNSLRFCDDRQNPIPYNQEVKIAGSYLLPWFGIQLNTGVQSFTGARTRVEWTLSRTTLYPENCAAPCPANTPVVPTLTVPSLVVALTAPGERLYPRHNQLDFGVRKIFHVRKVQYSAQADIFNLNNSSRVSAETQALGPSLGRPTAILQPRLLRLAVQMRF